MDQAIQDSSVVVLHPDPGADISANEVWEANLHCRTKAYLLLHGQHGTKCDYEAMCRQQGADVRRLATKKLLAEHGPSPTDVAVIRSLLKQGPSLILDARLATDFGQLHYDGLKKVSGASNLGDFHYVPILFHGGPKARKEQQSLLELSGMVLGGVQGKVPSKGVIFCGRDCCSTAVRLSAAPAKTRRTIEDCGRLRDSSEPTLTLNDHCQVCEFRQRCREQAIKQDSLSLLRMGAKQISTYARKGILTLTQLAHTFRPRRKGKRAESSKHRYHALQAMALRDKTVFVLGTPTLPASSVKVYLDVEGDPEEGYIYLIGLLVCDGVSEQSHSFWADSRDQETTIVQRALDVLAQYQDFQVFCYGSYDKTSLKKIRPKVAGKRRLDWVMERMTNVLSIVYSHVYFPAYTNGLKDVAACLGYAWTEKTASGIQSVVWRRNWESTHDEAWKQRLVTYNQEDCHALRTVVTFIEGLAARMSPAVASPAGSASTPQPAVVAVQDIDRQTYPRRWGVVNFLHPDYEFVNKCAYFDYQRQRVFVRTNKRIRKSVRKEGKGIHFNRHLRLSARIKIVSSKCPVCKSKELTVVDTRSPRSPRVKRAFDIVWTSTGVRRKVIECRASVQKCQSCGHEFIPPDYEQLDKHWHGLKSWAMFQHVAYGTSGGVLEELFREFFDLRVHDNEVLMFKSLLARYYKPTYRNLLKTILAGPVMHMDDTEVKLKTEKAYVTVITSLEEVVFVYRPSKEGSFVQDLLKGFHGVLVSDFHPTYDSARCPQQKCLIHLMRDINQDLLNHPFDQELQAISGAFGILLRSVIETVDQHGLKKHYLQKHERDVAKFFEFVITTSFQSNPARRLQDRFAKCRDKLFTFIKYDGVPWNNTNAENAIKRFAFYREDTRGTLSPEGLTDYLILLSICQTCRYKGVSFLKFLFSRERDLDAFCEGRCKRRRICSIETYPKGYVPPTIASLRKRKVTSSTEQASVEKGE